MVGIVEEVWWDPCTGVLVYVNKSWWPYFDGTKPEIGSTVSIERNIAKPPE